MIENTDIKNERIAPRPNKITPQDSYPNPFLTEPQQTSYQRLRWRSFLPPEQQRTNQ